MESSNKVDNQNIDFIISQQKKGQLSEEQEQRFKQILEKVNRRKDKTDFVQKVDIKPELFVVSDLHGDINRWNIIKEQLKQHTNRQFIIEGDAINRGAISKKIDKNELIDWLGKCPIQRTVHIGENKYALAHAIFDTELYKKDRDFNLEKAFDLKTKINKTSEEQQVSNRFQNCCGIEKKM